MKKVLFCILGMLLATSVFAKITTQKDSKGWRLFDGETEVEVKGITWSNNPIGSNYTYSLWGKDDDYILKMIQTDMPLLKAMGVNAVRCFNDVPPKWVEYIYENYGIYTIINNLLGRYGVTVNGMWNARTDYSDPATRKVLVDMAVETVEKYKDTKGVLMFMWGNESNYGLEWSGSDIENLPVGEQHKAKARYLYSMFNEAIVKCKEIDDAHPHGIVNGDVQYIDLIAELCPQMDIFGSNVYRGWKFYDSFYQDVKEKLDRPIIVTECGADAFNSVTNKEDQYGQLQYYKTQWREIFDQSYGKGNYGNILGCFVFEWVDEWWKYLQYTNLTEHDTFASWANGGYSLDYAEGKNNMSEEWFGICAQSREMKDGINIRVPRAVYYFLQDIWQMSMYNSTPAEIEKKFSNLPESTYLARGNEQSVKSSLNESKMVRLESADTTVTYTSPVHVNGIVDAIKNGKSFKEALSYRNTADNGVKNPEAKNNKPSLAAETEVKVAVQPFENLKGSSTLKVWTSEPISRLRDPYASYYVNHEYSTVEEAKAGSAWDFKKYVDLYAANVEYTGKYFNLNGFYHTGHGSYGTSGDIFALSQEAYDLIGYDTYGSKAPIGIEVAPHGVLEGLKVMAGPELWGGAEPMLLANWSKWIPEKGALKPGFFVGATASTGFREKQVVTLDPYNAYGSGNKVSLYGEMYIGKLLDAKLGLLYSGDEKLGADYKTYKGETKRIGYLDTLGAFVEVSSNAIPNTKIYLDAAYRGLVAESGAVPVAGGHYLGDSGSGNRIEFKLGADYGFNSYGVSAAFRYRTPIEKAKDRSLLDGSPFAVDFGNRPGMEVEAVLTYDPEGATYFFNWDANEIENAKIAYSIGAHYVITAGQTDFLIYKDNQYSSAVRGNGITQVGQTWVNGGTLGNQGNIWEIDGKIISNPIPKLKLIGTLGAGHINSLTGYFGDHEYITYFKAGGAVRYKKLIANANCTVNGLAPESWWRNFNLTFPLQYSFDIAYGLGEISPSFIDSKNRIGMRIDGRNFGDNCSDAYHALPNYVGNDVDGQKYFELSFYLSLGL